MRIPAGITKAIHSVVKAKYDPKYQVVCEKLLLGDEKTKGVF